METKAILLIFNGSAITEACLQQLGKVLAEYCNASTDVDTFVYNAKDIANAIVKKEGTGVIIKKEEPTPIEASIIYLGNILEEALTAPFNSIELASAITDKVIKLKGVNEEQHRRFMNALFILSQEDLIVSKSLMRKYHFSQEKLLVFKKVYNLLTKL